MNRSNKRQFIVFSALFITLVLNGPRLLAMRKDGLLAHLWRFNLNELIVQTIINLLFCLVLLWWNKDRIESLNRPWSFSKQGRYIGINLCFIAGFSLLALLIQKLLFPPDILPGGGNVFRIVVSAILIFLELRIVAIMEDSRSKEMENEHLRNAYLNSQVELLKGQLNPHFFFNALSSLSAVVREDPDKAQHYISHLSKTFRYTLESSNEQLVTLKEEIRAVGSYAQLLKMRYESGFELVLEIDEAMSGARLPHMSLQPLIENALKHNKVVADNPLRITMKTVNGGLDVSNNLQPVKYPEPGTGTGLMNLSERFRILMKETIEIRQTDDSFTVHLPLQ